MDGQQDGQNEHNEPTWQFKPGETISPRQSNPTATESTPSVAQESEITPPKPEVEPSPATGVDMKPATVAEAPDQAPQPVPTAPAPSAVAETTQISPPPSQLPEDGFVSWTASEYISHEKSVGWHVGIVVIAIVIASLVWFVTRDLITSMVIVIAAAVLSMYGARRPEQLKYQLDDHGLSIGQKHYSFSDFRAFSLVEEGPFTSIVLVPSKRFAPLTTLYFDPNDEDKIAAILGTHLPLQERKADAVDGLMRKIRF